MRKRVVRRVWTLATAIVAVWSVSSFGQTGGGGLGIGRDPIPGERPQIELQRPPATNAAQDPANPATPRANPALPDQNLRPGPGDERNALVAHALAMAIQSTTLKGLAASSSMPDRAQPAGATAAANQDASQQLMTHAQKSMQASRSLLVTAAKGMTGAPQNPGGRNFYDAASAYITTLDSLCGDSKQAADAAPEADKAKTDITPADKASIALINHSICEVMEGCKIRKFARMMPDSTSQATERMLAHSREMSTEGQQTLLRYLGSIERGNPQGDQAKAEPNANPAEASAKIVLLAQQGRNVIDAIMALERTELGIDAAQPRGNVRSARPGDRSFNVPPAGGAIPVIPRQP